MQWTLTALTRAWASDCLIKAQASVYAAFANGSLTVAFLNLALMAFAWGIRRVLKRQSSQASRHAPARNLTGSYSGLSVENRS